MKKPQAEASRQRLYLLIILLLAGLSFYIFFVRGQESSIPAQMSTTDVAVLAEAASGTPLTLVKPLPFIWSRAVSAGERIHDEMFLYSAQAVATKDEALQEANLQEAKLSVSGRYLRYDRAAGSAVRLEDISESIPLKPAEGKQAQWVALKEAQAALPDNYRLGQFVSAYSQNAGAPTTLENLQYIRVLAMDKASAYLCLELSTEQYLQILTQDEFSRLYFVPHDKAGGPKSSASSSAIPTSTSAVSETSASTVATTPVTSATNSTIQSVTATSGTDLSSIESSATSVETTVAGESSSPATVAAELTPEASHESLEESIDDSD